MPTEPQRRRCGCGTVGYRNGMTAVRADSPLPRLLQRFVTPEAVYGLVLFAAIVAAVSDEADEGSAEATIELNGATTMVSASVIILIWVTMSTIVFWGAHVFAHAVAGHGMRDGEEIKLRRAIGEAFHRSAGMLYAPIIPAIPLVLGAFGVISDDAAVEITLWTAVAVLAVLGFLAFVARHAHIVIAILGGLGTAVLGLVIIFMNAIMH